MDIVNGFRNVNWNKKVKAGSVYVDYKYGLLTKMKRNEVLKENREIVIGLWLTQQN